VAWKAKDAGRGQENGQAAGHSHCGGMRATGATPAGRPARAEAASLSSRRLESGAPLPRRTLLDCADPAAPAPPKEIFWRVTVYQCTLVLDHKVVVTGAASQQMILMSGV